MEACRAHDPEVPRPFLTKLVEDRTLDRVVAGLCPTEGVKATACDAEDSKPSPILDDTRRAVPVGMCSRDMMVIRTSATQAVACCTQLPALHAACRKPQVLPCPCELSCEKKFACPSSPGFMPMRPTRACLLHAWPCTAADDACKLHHSAMTLIPAQCSTQSGCRTQTGPKPIPKHHPV